MCKMASVALVFSLGVAAHAGYIITPTHQGASEVIAAPGEPIVIDLVLTRSASEVHNSSIFRVTFSSPGLMYLNYGWKSPYLDDTIDDFSTPVIASLPTILDSTVLSRPGDPLGIVDIELSNVTPFGTTFAEGIIASLTFMFPVGYSGAETILIGVEPDTFQFGTQPPIETTAGAPLEFRLVPVPGAAGIFLLSMVQANRRRRH